VINRLPLWLSLPPSKCFRSRPPAAVFRQTHCRPTPRRAEGGRAPRMLRPRAAVRQPGCPPPAGGVPVSSWRPAAGDWLDSTSLKSMSFSKPSPAPRTSPPPPRESCDSFPPKRLPPFHAQVVLPFRSDVSATGHPSYQTVAGQGRGYGMFDRRPPALGAIRAGSRQPRVDRKPPAGPHSELPPRPFAHAAPLSDRFFATSPQEVGLIFVK